MRAVLISAILVLVACATSSGVVETGPDSYLITKQAGTGFAGLGTMKADNIKEARAFCKDHGKNLQITGTQETPGGIGRYPYSEIQFMCLTDGDPRLKGGPLVPVFPAPADKVMNGQ